MTMIFLLFIAFLTASISCCEFRNCALRVHNQVVEIRNDTHVIYTPPDPAPLFVLENITRAGLVSLNVKVLAEHENLELVRVTSKHNSSHNFTLQLGLNGKLLLQEVNKSTQLRRCMGACRINLGWRLSSCRQTIELKYSEGLISILFHRHHQDSLEGYKMELLNPTWGDQVIPRSEVKVSDLVLFDHFSTHRNMEREVFNSQRVKDYSRAAVNWESVLKLCCPAGFALVRDMYRPFLYHDLTSDSKDVLLEVKDADSVEEDDGDEIGDEIGDDYDDDNLDESAVDYRSNYLYLNISHHETEKCHLQHR